jgi:hypothetical protein
LIHTLYNVSVSLRCGMVQGKNNMINIWSRVGKHVVNVNENLIYPEILFLPVPTTLH